MHETVLKLPGVTSTAHPLNCLYARTHPCMAARYLLVFNCSIAPAAAGLMVSLAVEPARQHKHIVSSVACYRDYVVFVSQHAHRAAAVTWYQASGCNRAGVQGITQKFSTTRP